jgi:hypothetical protein
MMNKGPGTNADMVFLDLEDAVAPKEKEASRARIVSAIRGNDWGNKVLCVRINDWSTKWTAYDILEVVGNAGDRLDEIMLPKVENAAQVVAADLLLRQVEIASGLPVGPSVLKRRLRRHADSSTLKRFVKQAHVSRQSFLVQQIFRRAWKCQCSPVAYRSRITQVITSITCSARF